MVRACLRFCFALVLASSVARPAFSEATARKNFVVVLADDLGYGDLHCYGHPRVKTPNLDRFAKQGLKLTSCYSAAPNCSPSRAGLMTGRTPSRVGIYNWIPMYSPMHLRRSEITIATLLQNAGYDTGHIGKWHLNGCFNLVSQPQPWDHGFRFWYSTQNNALPNHRNPFNFVQNGEEVGPQKGYAGEIVAREAVHWLKQRRLRNRPFFLFVCFHEPHEPIASAKRFTDLYPSDDPSYSAHHGNISQLDESFGKIIKALDELKLRDTTTVIFTSDNGPAITGIHPHGSSGPLRDKKGFVTDGGIRVPGLVQSPGVTSPGQVSDTPVSGVDWLPTICELAGVALPRDRELDGASVVNILRGRKLVRKRPLYWQFHRARGPHKVAIRDGKWKLLARMSSPELRPNGGIVAGEMKAMKAARLVDFELYDLSSDIAETSKQNEQYPEVFKRMKQKIVAFHKEVTEEGPVWPEWEFARHEGQLIEWPSYRKRRR